MKKILLTMALLFSLVLVGKSQAVLNEFYHNPASGEKEYIEIYNAAGAENLNCYTLIIKYNTGSEQGFFVINYPNIILPAQAWSVTAAGLPFNYQAGTYTGGANDFSWNDPNLVANGGYFKQFKLVSGSYTEVGPPPAITTDILQTLPSGDGAKYITLLYRNGLLINGLVINGGTTVPVGLTGMPPLTVPADNTGTCAGFTATFSTITTPQLEYMTPAIGSSNGAFRTKDGTCGSWEKSNNAGDNTPGATNGGSGPLAGVITVGGTVLCPFHQPGNTRTATYFIVNSGTPANAYPLILELYSDNGTTLGQKDAGDQFLTSRTYLSATATQETNTFELTGGLVNKPTMIVARSTAGCFATIQQGPNTCSPLPVKFKSFNAARNHSVVALNWETASEQNNSGFAIERLVGAGGWQQIGFVSSKGAGGNSNSDLSYQYTDLNNTSAMTQYRLKQIDFDNKSSMSDIRAVRGLGQVGKTIVYPNPSNNGRVSVVFEDASATRDISLMDMSGRMIKQIKAVTNNNIQFDNLTPGVYSLRVVNRETGDQVVEKIVVNKR